MDSVEVAPFEVELENFTCDLLAMAKNQPALQRLFKAKKAQWVSANDLCATVAGLHEAYTELRKQLPGELLTTWLDCPPMDPEMNNVLVLFFIEDLVWSKVAIFNRRTLPKPRDTRPRKAATTGGHRGK